MDCTVTDKSPSCLVIFLSGKSHYGIIPLRHLNDSNSSFSQSTISHHQLVKSNVRVISFYTGHIKLGLPVSPK
jgi:hypothetical protein